MVCGVHMIYVYIWIYMYISAEYMVMYVGMYICGVCDSNGV